MLNYRLINFKKMIIHNMIMKLSLFYYSLNFTSIIYFFNHMI